MVLFNLLRQDQHIKQKCFQYHKECSMSHRLLSLITELTSKKSELFLSHNDIEINITSQFTNLVKNIQQTQNHHYNNPKYNKTKDKCQIIHLSLECLNTFNLQRIYHDWQRALVQDYIQLEKPHKPTTIHQITKRK